MFQGWYLVNSLCIRALRDIMSGPEVRKIYKIRTVLRPDISLPRRWPFNTVKNRKKIFNSKFTSIKPLELDELSGPYVPRPRYEQQRKPTKGLRLLRLTAFFSGII